MTLNYIKKSTVVQAAAIIAALAFIVFGIGLQTAPFASAQIEVDIEGEQGTTTDEADEPDANDGGTSGGGAALDPEEDEDVTTEAESDTTAETDDDSSTTTASTGNANNSTGGALSNTDNSADVDNDTEVEGEVISVEGNVVTVQTEDGIREYTIPASAPVERDDNDAAQVSDIQPGDTITIMRTEDGQVLGVSVESDEATEDGGVGLPLILLLIVLVALGYYFYRRSSDETTPVEPVDGHNTTRSNRS